MQTRSFDNKPVTLILKGVAVAMGIAVVILQVLGAATPSTLFTLLGLGLFALAVSALQSEKEHDLSGK